VKSVSAKMRVWNRLAVQTLACSAALTLATPAVPQGQTQNPPTIKAEVSLVNLFATVRDKNKRVVTDLKQDNFKISEDGHEEKIAFFSKEMMLPITLGLLLDTSGSEQNMLGAIQGRGADSYAASCARATRPWSSPSTRMWTCFPILTMTVRFWTGRSGKQELIRPAEDTSRETPARLVQEI